MPNAIGKSLSILGGGAAGVFVGYFARKKDIPFHIYEASKRLGGNSITHRYGEFLFDSGAHRWHDKDPEMTREICDLMGERLRKIFVPSQIIHSRKFVDFPLSPLNLFANLGPIQFTRATLEIVFGLLKRQPSDGSFENFALKTYGATIAGQFLLNYSEKLWGLPCGQLSPDIAGKRMKGLNLKTFVKEAMGNKQAKTEHLDGSFYYPDEGIGTIIDTIAGHCGPENISMESRATRVFHDNNRITAIELDGGRLVPTDFLVSTIPLNHFFSIMEPKPPEHLMAMCKQLRYRHLRLVALFLNMNSITKAATVYFPESEYPFTRLYEPKNRSLTMAPDGKTSLVIEIPCQQDDEVWQASESDLIQKISEILIGLGWVKKDQIIGGAVREMAYAYPILEKGFAPRVQQIYDYFSQFRNLAFSGRCGKFQYTHLHDMMRLGKEITDNISQGIVD